MPGGVAARRRSGSRSRARAAPSRSPSRRRDQRLGVAAFHPEGARYANYASGSRRGTGMSFFSVGGNVGFALGPIFVTPLVLVFGLSGTLALVVLPAIVPWSSSGRCRACTRRRGRPSGGPRRGRPARGRLERLHAPGRRHLPALRRLLRPAVVRPALVRPPARLHGGGGQHGADRDARRRARSARWSAAGWWIASAAAPSSSDRWRCSCRCCWRSSCPAACSRACCWPASASSRS